ncbi:hypothetical protein BBJ28_00007406 [Nothophytophthora sp. Chile5]|nr:hypothetical protein BBJ28_00007406 [Nothophytophthora sp. Chile5]
MSGAETAFMVLTIISSILVRISPWPDFRRVHKAKATGEVVVLPVVVLFVNCYVLVWYGYLSDDIFPLLSTSVFGLVTCLFFLAVFYRWTENRRSVHYICLSAVVIIIIVTIYGVLGVVGATGQSESGVSSTMGAISIGTAIGNYGSPLATIRRVVTKKSTASMPFTMSLMNFFNSVCWIVYAVIISDMFVLIPNVVGGVLTSIQLVLYAVYPSKPNEETQLASVMIDHTGSLSRYEREASLSVIITTPVQEGGVGRKDSLDFTTFQVLTIISSILVRISPWPDFQRVLKAKATGEVAVLPVVMLFTNCVVLVWYGYLTDDIFPLFSTAILGLLTCAGFIAIFYRWTDNRRAVHKTCSAALLVIVLVCLYGVLGVLGVTGQSNSSVGTAMGAISIGTAIGLYASPLATIRRVIRTKSTASMPFFLCLANFFNSVCWIIYAIIIVDMFVLIPNAIGGVLTAIQLVLYAIYPTKKTTEVLLDSVMIDHTGTFSRFEREASLSVIITTPVQDGGRFERKSSLDRKDSLDFCWQPIRQLREGDMAENGLNKQTMSILETTFQVLSIITSIFVRFSPWPDFYRVHKQQTTGDVAILPVVMLFTNCVVLVWYGYLTADIFPLFSTAILGLFTCAGFAAIFYRWTDDKHEVHQICLIALLFILLVTVYGVLGVLGMTGQSDSAVATAMGAISIGTSIGNFGSPLATIRRVVHTESTASMPFTLCLANFVNSVAWTVYAVIISDVWVLIPNAMGAVLTTFQLVLFVIYPTKKYTDDDDVVIECAVREDWPAVQPSKLKPDEVLMRIATLPGRKLPLACRSTGNRQEAIQLATDGAETNDSIDQLANLPEVFSNTETGTLFGRTVLDCE